MLALHVLEVMEAFGKASDSGKAVEITTSVERPAPLSQSLANRYPAFRDALLVSAITPLPAVISWWSPALAFGVSPALAAHTLVLK